ncbi:MAG: ABC transporter permease [Waddliaceae bacterium]
MEATLWSSIWQQFRQHKIGVVSGCVLFIFCLVGLYAPFLASSKPLFVIYRGEMYFPLFRYLLYTGFYTKPIDIFFNLAMFTLPLSLLFRKKAWVLAVVAIQLLGFIYIVFKVPSDPAADLKLMQERQQALKESPPISWEFDLKYMNRYAKLNRLVQYKLLKERETTLPQHAPSLWKTQEENRNRLIQIYQKSGDTNSLQFLLDKREWLEEESRNLHWMVMPLISPFHWEDDAGGGQEYNRAVSFWQLTRINGKDLTAALIFGIRISLVVGILAVSIAVIIGIPIGSLAGYFGGSFDIVVSRLLEIWESMPIFFMLLLFVSITQSKSIFLVISVIGFFSWTTFSRYIRAEVFKQRNLPYVEAAHAIGFTSSHILFSDILPNAIPPILTLLPFSIMGAITSEAALSFLGLGEEGSCSWGVLMDEGRQVFPGESYLLWPPAILLTILLISIALVGDSMRDALDPKLRK